MILLTVLFSDLVGSTQLSSQFDPEDWRDIVLAYQRVSVNVLQRLGGHVAQYGVPIVVEQEATILLTVPGKVLKRQGFEEHGKGTNKLGGMTADTVQAICSAACKSLIEKRKAPGSQLVAR